MFDDVARQAEAAEMCLAGCGMAAEDYQAELRSQLPASSGRLIITDEEQERVYRRWRQASASCGDPGAAGSPLWEAARDHRVLGPELPVEHL